MLAFKSLSNLKPQEQLYTLSFSFRSRLIFPQLEQVLDDGNHYRGFINWLPAFILFAFYVLCVLYIAFRIGFKFAYRVYC
jgi:hypothetical protein